jgi:hypothetical protein
VSIALSPMSLDGQDGRIMTIGVVHGRLGFPVKVLVRSVLLASLGFSVAAGCTADRLRDRSVNQAQTLTDLYYQQVLGNLARLHLDPSALPSHVSLHDGTTQIQDNGSVTATLR